MLDSLHTIRFKTLRDLWGNRGRTLLVALSIAIGVIGIGMIIATWDVLTSDIRRRYGDINPAHIELVVPKGVTQDGIENLAKMPGVTAAQGRAVFSGRYRHADESAWRTIEFIAFNDPNAQTVNKIVPESGTFPPARWQLVAERASLDEMDARVGDTIIVDAMGHEHTIQIVGTAHQQDDVMASVKGNPIVIVSLETMQQLQGNDRFNTIYLTVNDFDQRAVIADAARARLEKSGYTVSRVTLHDPAIHPTQDVLDVLLLVMGILGVLSLLLSGLLVTNTIGALVTQQIKQIGVMKALGADTWLVIRAYALTVLAFGLLGTLLGSPIAERTGYQLAKYLAGKINVDLYAYRPSTPAMMTMALVGLLVPFIAAAKPLWEGAGITVRQAISDYGLGGGNGDNALSRILGRVQNLPREWALALRNAVRVPDRLALTLATLALGGAIFIAVLSVDASFSNTIDNLLEGQYGMDTLIAFNKQQRSSKVVELAQTHPEVKRAEAWYFAQATMKLASGQQVQVLVEAGPDNTQFYTPRLVAGRWLAPNDTNAIVVNRKWAEQEGVKLGDVVILDLGDAYSETEWVVVGVNQDLVQKQTSVFVSLDELDRVMKRTDRTYTLEVAYTQHDAASQKRITNELVTLFAQNGVDVFSTQILGEIKRQVTSLYQILVVFLLVMSFLIALVGGIGLMGMMSINVLERSKEIGVMRAVGADTRAIVQIFWGESIVVTLMSFVVALALSVPLARGMSRAVGMAFIQTPLDFAYAWHGIAYWFVIVMIVGTLASIAPALNAANLSVRQSLSYE
ncbi:MAG: ABC transporter permease [Chloroflexi bacterium]|nr:ABC transporter permease [Chloroflexota bacterium]